MVIRSSKTLLLWAVSFLALYYVVSQINWPEFFNHASKISLLEIVALVAIYLLGFIPRSIRSKLMLPLISKQSAVAGVVIGYAANNLLPARLGEFVRAQLIAKVEKIRLSTTLSSIAFERVLDGFIIVILLFIGSGDLLPDWAEQARWLGFYFFTGFFIIFLALGRFSTHFEPFLPPGKLGHMALGILEGAKIGCRKISTLTIIVVLSLLTWIIESMMFYLGFLVFGINQSFYAALFVLGVVNLGILIPNSPGNIGVFQYFTLLALSVFGISTSQAAAYSIVLHICQYVPVTVIGCFFLSKYGFRSFEEIKK